MSLSLAARELPRLSRLPGVLHELLSCPLRLRLYDHDRLSRDDPLGEARVFLRDRLTSGGVLDAQLTEPLGLPDQGRNARKVSSSITLHVTWSEKQGTAAAREEPVTCGLRKIAAAVQRKAGSCSPGLGCLPAHKNG